MSTIICAFVGTALYGDTIGYYLVARTKEGKRRAASKALRIPLFYAFVLAVVLKVSEVEAPEAVRPVADALSTVVSVLGTREKEAATLVALSSVASLLLVGFAVWIMGATQLS